MLNFAVYYDRGAIYRKKQSTEEVKAEEASTSCAAMLAFGFLLAGPIQLLTDLPFNHDIAFKGGKWLFALHFGAIIDFAAVLAVAYIDDGSFNAYWLLSCVLLQVLKGVLDLTIYVPMLLSDDTIDIVDIVEHDVQRRLSRLVQPRNSNLFLRQRSKSLPPIRNFAGFNQVTY